MICTSVCFGYSLTEEFGAHYRLKEKHESTYKQLLLDKIAREIPKILVLKRKC